MSPPDASDRDVRTDVAPDDAILLDPVRLWNCARKLRDSWVRRGADYVVNNGEPCAAPGSFHLVVLAGGRLSVGSDRLARRWLHSTSDYDYRQIKCKLNRAPLLSEPRRVAGRRHSF